MEHTLILKNLTKKEQRKAKRKLDTATDRMIRSVMEETPLNRLPLMSQGKIDYDMIEALLKVFSKEKGGLKELRKTYQANRKKRR